MRLALILENPQRLAYIQRMFTAKGMDPNRVIRASEHLLAADPTPQKNLAQWLAKLALGGLVSVRGIITATPETQIRLPEDTPRVQEVLTQFVRAKPRLPRERRDINQFRDFYTLETALQQAVDTGTVRAGATGARRVPGAEIIYDEPPYTIYHVRKIARSYKRHLDNTANRPPEEQVRINAIKDLGMGPPETKWCTRRNYAPSQAEHYLQSADMSVIYRDGAPFMQKCGKQVRNVMDHSAPLPPEIAAVIEAGIQREREKLQAELKAKMPELIAQFRNEQRSGVIHDSGKLLPFDAIVDMESYMILFYKLPAPVQIERHHGISQSWKIGLAAGLCKCKSAWVDPELVREPGSYIDHPDYEDDEYYSNSTYTIITTQYGIMTVNKDHIVEIINARNIIDPLTARPVREGI